MAKKNNTYPYFVLGLFLFCLVFSFMLIPETLACTDSNNLELGSCDGCDSPTGDQCCDSNDKQSRCSLTFCMTLDHKINYPECGAFCLDNPDSCYSNNNNNNNNPSSNASAATGISTNSETPNQSGSNDQPAQSGSSQKPAATPNSKIDLTNPLGSNVTVPILIGHVIDTALGVVGSLALLMFIYGGFTWMLAAGNESAIEKGKNILMWATIGLVVIFASYSLVGFIIKSITGS